MTNEWPMTNSQCPKATTRAKGWSFEIGHSLVIGHWSLVILWLLVIGHWSFLCAQPVPKLTSLSPDWIQRGTSGQIVFSGENLGTVTGFVFSGASGLTATNTPP